MSAKRLAAAGWGFEPSRTRTSHTAISQRFSGSPGQISPSPHSMPASTPREASASSAGSCTLPSSSPKTLEPSRPPSSPKTLEPSRPPSDCASAGSGTAPSATPATARTTTAGKSTRRERTLPIWFPRRTATATCCKKRPEGSRRSGTPPPGVGRPPRGMNPTLR